MIKQKILTLIFLVLIFTFFSCLVYQLVSDTVIFPFLSLENNDQKNEQFHDYSWNFINKSDQEKQTSLQNWMQNLDTSSWKKAIFLSFLKKDDKYFFKINWNQKQLQKEILKTIAEKINDISLNVEFKFYDQQFFKLKVSLKEQANIFVEKEYHVTDL